MRPSSMCTLIVLHQSVPGRPLIIAANRDEYLDRPATGPAVRPGIAGPVVAPLDERAGGTWLGVGPAGVFAGITNRPTARKDPSRRSRGLLVMDAMSAPDAAAAAAALERLPAGTYNPFNLVVADGAAAFVAIYEEEPKVRELRPGAHVIANADPNDRNHPKVARLMLEAGRASEMPAESVLGALSAVCRHHGAFENPLQSTCIHHGGYGTRSSALLAWEAPRRPARLHFADGPPCTTAYDDFNPLLRELPCVAAGD